MLHEREHVHRHQPEPVRVQPGEQQRNGHPHPAGRRRPAVQRRLRGSPAHHPHQRRGAHIARTRGQ